MKIYIAGPPGLDILGLHPWPELLDGVSERHEVVSSPEQADGIVIINHQLSVLNRAKRNGIPTNRRALIMLEPEATLPAHGQRTRLSSYAHIFCGSPYWAADVGGEEFIWPQEVDPVHPPINPAGDFDFRASMVAGQKRSAMRTSLYGLRRDVIQALGRLGVPTGLAGAGWDESRRQRWNRAGRSLVKATLANPAKVSLSQALGRVNVRGATYIGPVEDKTQFMRRAPIAIVIENSLDYVSEKLVDAIRAGVAPVYVGPPLGDFGLPPGVALSVDPHADEVVERVRATTSAELEECISRGQQWIRSRESSTHDARAVMRQLGERIGEIWTE